ncbi:MAG: PAS domain S-box protein, partial [Bacteroidetes bacterium]|nr:PAS domain S-box protein [Bacteroidota bacterium]
MSLYISDPDNPENTKIVDEIKTDPEVYNKLLEFQNIIDKQSLITKNFEKKVGSFNDVLLKYAQHDYTAQNEVLYNNDLIDSLALSINFLGEELNYSTVTKYYLDDIFNSMEDMLIVIDDSGYILTVNNTTQKRLKYKEENLFNSPISTILPSQIDFESIIDNQKINKNHYLLTSDGYSIPVLLNVSHFVRGDDQKIGFVIIARDISAILEYQSQIEIQNKELYKAMLKAEESDKLKTAFLANMSHEIRTPMNAIIGFSDILEMSPDIEKEEADSYLKIIRQRSYDLLKIINNILDISKIESSQMSLFEAEGKISQFLYGILNYYKENSIINNFSVEISVDNQIAPVDDEISTDFERLKQVYVNIINNALKFTEKGKIIFGCSKKDPITLLFYVSDTGIGIPYKNKEEIFAPFRQVNDSLTRKYDGVGLGLSICKGLIELMGGSIWFESKVGVGTTFYFTLPFKRAKLLSNDILIPVQSDFDWKNKKILIVEDDRFNSQYIIKILEKTKVNYLWASDGKSALLFSSINFNA